jgi:hypothetical protein
VGQSTGTLASLQQRADISIEMLERMLGAKKRSIERVKMFEALQSTGSEQWIERSANQAGAE